MTLELYPCLKKPLSKEKLLFAELLLEKLEPESSEVSLANNSDSNSLAEFASAMGVSTLPSSGSVAGSSDITIANNGVSGSAAPTFTISKSGSSVDEGSSVTFTITASSAVSADTTFSWTVIGDSNGSTVDKAGTSDIDVLSGNATIAAGASSTTFTVTASSDSIVEGIEGIKVSVFDADSSALSSSQILVNNSGSAATSQSYTLTTGVDTLTGRSGNDSFDATTASSMNDYDVIDGDSEYKYLRTMSIDSVEEENLKKLLQESGNKKIQMETLNNKSIENIWLDELKELSKK